MVEHSCEFRVNAGDHLEVFEYSCEFRVNTGDHLEVVENGYWDRQYMVTL